MKKIEGKVVRFVERERYYAFIAEHEIILIPRNNLPVQVKRYQDGSVKVTTLNPEWANVPRNREIDKTVWEDYLEKRGNYKEQYIQQ